jgi:SAM-dependent methyltransferase
MKQAPYQPATNYWRAIEIGEIVRYGLPTGRGLDLGCGDGHLMGIILGRVGPRDLIGIDVDERETTMARKRHIYREVVTTAGDRLPFPESYFDYVFSNSVLEHIQPIDNTLREVARVLRPEGHFVFTVPGSDFHRCLRGPKFGNRDAYLQSVDARCFHLRYWDASEWREHLRPAGLELVHQHGYLSDVEVQRWESLARYTSGILYGFVRGKKQPIEIQRTLGVRSTRFHLPRSIAWMAARLIGTTTRPDGPHFGCLLMEAQKR